MENTNLSKNLQSVHLNGTFSTKMWLDGPSDYEILSQLLRSSFECLLMGYTPDLSLIQIENAYQKILPKGQAKDTLQEVVAISLSVSFNLS